MATRSPKSRACRKIFPAANKSPMRAVLDKARLMSQMRRTCRLSHMRYRKSRAREIITSFALFSSIVADLGGDHVAVQTIGAMEAAVGAVESAGQMLIDHSDLNVAALGQIEVVQATYIRCLDRGREATHDAMMVAFQERGLHEMHRPATTPPCDDTPACFVCCDAPPSDEIKCCRQSSIVCSACFDRSNGCPFCRAGHRG
jgi:hypothetical protein